MESELSCLAWSCKIWGGGGVLRLPSLRTARNKVLFVLQGYNYQLFLNNSPGNIGRCEMCPLIKATPSSYLCHIVSAPALMLPVTCFAKCEPCCLYISMFGKTRALNQARFNNILALQNNCLLPFSLRRCSEAYFFLNKFFVCADIR